MILPPVLLNCGERFIDCDKESACRRKINWCIGRTKNQVKLSRELVEPSMIEAGTAALLMEKEEIAGLAIYFIRCAPTFARIRRTIRAHLL